MVSVTWSAVSGRVESRLETTFKSALSKKKVVMVNNDGVIRTEGWLEQVQEKEDR